MEAFLQIFVQLISWIVFIYLAFSAFYFLIFSVAGLTYSDPEKINDKIKKIAVMIPGYKEDRVIVEVARHSLEQNYPTEKYDIVVIADSFQETTLQKLKKLPIKVLEVSFEVSTKAKAINRAFEILPKDYDLVVILDADNLMETDFLSKVSSQMNDSKMVLQAHRVAKNMNTNLAVLDAVSEEINNHAFRKGHRALGLSAALIGSGMVFNYNLLKTYMSQITAIGGFDKELELNLIKDGHKINYLQNALVYDEKVQKASAFKGQRRRWLSVQFIYFGRYIRKGIWDLITKGKVDFFDKVIQMSILPRILLIGLTFTLVLPIIILGNIELTKGIFQWVAPGLLSWELLFGSVLLAFLAAIPRKFYNMKTLFAIATLPKGFMLMFASLLKIRGANKKFIHTQHGTTH